MVGVASRGVLFFVCLLGAAHSVAQGGCATVCVLGEVRAVLLCVLVCRFVLSFLARIKASLNGMCV